MLRAKEGVSDREVTSPPCACVAFQIAHFLASYAALDILTSATPEQFFSSLGRLLAFLPLHTTIASCSDVILHYSKMCILSVLYCSYSSVSSPSLPEEYHITQFSNVLLLKLWIFPCYVFIKQLSCGPIPPLSFPLAALIFHFILTSLVYPL